jgi:release factor glutamine methyltransferase
VTCGQWLSKYTTIFQQAGIAEAAGEAEVLLGHTLELGRADIYSRPERIITAGELVLLESVAGRRLKREPSAYILRHKEFFGLDIYVDPRVLIPRPETEVLVEAAIEFARSYVEADKRAITIIDVGTGSGAIAIALAVHIPGSLVYAADISTAALEVAAENIGRHNLGARAVPVQSDLLMQINTEADIIAANLPYIPRGGMRLLQPEIANYEPGLALDGGPGGTETIARLLGQLPGKIKPGGAVFLEIGEGQEDGIMPVIARCLPGSRVTLIKDLSGIHRVIKIAANLRNN